jgi:nucleoid-associated protein
LNQDRQDEPVDVRELSFALDDIDREAFVSTVEQEQPFYIDRRSMQRYVKFSGREKDLSISFSSSQLNDRVVFDAGSDTLSIKGLPKALRDQLLGHLKG